MNNLLTNRVFILSIIFIFLLSTTTVSFYRPSFGEFVQDYGETNWLSRIVWIFLLIFIFTLIIKNYKVIVESLAVNKYIKYYIFCTFISVIISHYFFYSFGRYFSFLIYIISAIVISSLVRNIDDFYFQQRILLKVLLSFFIISLIGTIIFPSYVYGVDAYENIKRFRGIFSYPTMVGTTAVFTILLSSLVSKLDKKKIQLKYIIINSILFICIFLSESRGALIGLGISYLSYLYFAKKGKKIVNVFLIGIAFIFLIFGNELIYLFIGVFNYIRHGIFIADPFELLTLTGRLFLWEAIINSHSISFFGIGFSTLFYGENGTKLLAYGIGIFGGAHNAYLEPLYETGLLGISSLLFLLFSYLKHTFNFPSYTDASQYFKKFLIIFSVFVITQTFVISTFTSKNIFLWLIIYYFSIILRNKIIFSSSSKLKVVEKI